MKENLINKLDISDLSELEEAYNRINKILEWPFDYKTLFTLLFGSLITLLPFLINIISGSLAN